MGTAVLEPGASVRAMRDPPAVRHGGLGVDGPLEALCTAEEDAPAAGELRRGARGELGAQAARLPRGDRAYRGVLLQEGECHHLRRVRHGRPHGWVGLGLRLWITVARPPGLEPFAPHGLGAEQVAGH